MPNNFLEWIKERHDKIMACETDAIALMRAGDINGYRAKMWEKAELLANLAEGAEPELRGYSRAAEARETLARFSSSAGTALELNSVFYMSALLHNDDAKDGDPDNLELLIKELES